MTLDRPLPGFGMARRMGYTLDPRAIRELCARAREAETRSYRICGRTLRLHCDSPEYARHFERTYRHLRCPETPVDGPLSELTFLTRERGPEGFPALLDPLGGTARVFSHEEVLPTYLFFSLAFVEEMFPLSDHVILHAGAVEWQGRVTALVGLTRSGKSTLSLWLGRLAGISFLSDEFCPIRLASGRVDPFPRAIGLRSGSRRLLRDREIAVEDERHVDPTEITGLQLGSGGRIENIVLISGGDLSEPMNRQNERLLAVQFVNAGLLASLQAVPGVVSAQVHSRPVGPGTAVRVEVEPDQRVTEELLRVCRDEHGMDLFGVLPPRALTPDFDTPPELCRIPTTPALIELVRQIANRTALSRRLQSESYPKLLDLLAGLLGGVRFFSLKPGPLEATSSLLRQEVIQL